MPIFLLFAVAAIFIVNGIPLIRKKQWRDLTVSVGIMAIACVLVVGKNAGMPAPLKSLDGLFQGLGKRLFG